MRNKRLLLKNKNLKLDRKIIINLKKLNIIKSIKCFKYWTVIMMDLYPKNILISKIYLFYKYKLLLKFSHLDQMTVQLKVVQKELILSKL